MIIKSAYVKIKDDAREFDIFNDARDAAQFINRRAAEAGWLEKGLASEIASCHDAIQESLEIAEYEIEIDEE